MRGNLRDPLGTQRKSPRKERASTCDYFPVRLARALSPDPTQTGSIFVCGPLHHCVKNKNLFILTEIFLRLLRSAISNFKILRELDRG